MPIKLVLSSLAFFLSTLPAALGMAASFTVIDSFPTGIRSIREASSLSADGTTVVGTVLAESRETRAFVWNAANGIQLIDGFPVGTTNSIARDVSSDGSKIVGVAGTSSGGEVYQWDASNGVQLLGPLPGGVSLMSDFLTISDDGSTVVTGSYDGNPNGAIDFLKFETFVWDSANAWRGLSQLPGGGTSNWAGAVSGDGSRITGADYSGGGIEAFLWDASTGIRRLGDVPGGEFGSAGLSISADGSTVVGWSAAEPSDVRLGSRLEAMIWDETNGIRSLGSLFEGRFESFAVGVSADGSVVVGTDNLPATPGGFGRPHSRAFVWTEATGMQGLDVLLSSLGVDYSDWRLIEANAISADGRTILGHAV
ncbi:HAF repeat/PEP-CTERM domain-containing protein, partial [Myxococcota bacterium]|nr:HAF repeat/PEP-CTERM domain-containing protein [Myxococcota bacterium]